MKVAIVYHFFAHYRGPIINELLIDDNIDYYFISGRKASNDYSSLKLYDVNKSNRFITVENKWIHKYFLWQKGLFYEIKKGKYDAIIFLGDWKHLSTWVSLIYANICNINTYFWGHGLLDNSNSINNYIKIKFHKIFNSGGFVYSEKARDNLKMKGLDNSVNVVYNSLDYKRMNSVMDEHEKISCQSIKKPYIIFSGRIIKERKLEILFEALYILQSNGVELKAVIIGDGPYLPFIKNLATKYSLVDSVDFVGSCYDENIIYSYYKSAVACVFPGPVGLTAIHSLTYGIPIITNDNMMKHKPEVEAVKEGTTGFYFKDNNVHSLVDVLKHVLSINDNDLRIIANNAKGIIKNKYNPIYQSGVFNRSLYKKT